MWYYMGARVSVGRRRPKKIALTTTHGLLNGCVSVGRYDTAQMRQTAYDLAKGMGRRELLQWLQARAVDYHMAVNIDELVELAAKVSARAANQFGRPGRAYSICVNTPLYTWG